MVYNNGKIHPCVDSDSRENVSRVLSLSILLVTSFRWIVSIVLKRMTSILGLLKSLFPFAVPVAYASFQARGPVRATAASLCYSHTNARSKPCL